VKVQATGLNPFSLEGKVAMITGGSRGIGYAAARALLESGARVILISRSESDLKEAQNALQAVATDPSDVMYCPADLMNTAAISGKFRDCVDRFGKPDILVNAAGMTRRGEATQLTLDDWHHVLSLNVTAVFELSRCFARELIPDGKSGKIINIASLMTAAARPGTSAYTSSKGAVGQLTKALAVDWAPHRILVNAVAPGYIRTELTSSLAADPDFDRWVKKRTPLGRWGEPDDIAWPIIFLASAASNFITGQVIYVDGGWISTF
jgi:gluconate 5-dehydrogenase